MAPNVADSVPESIKIIVHRPLTPLTAYDLLAADEVFLSSTAGGVMPVVEIEGRRIGDGKVGVVTRDLHERYWKMREQGRHGTAVFATEPMR